MVKTNLVEVLQRELRRPGWQHEHVALGTSTSTSTDPYQRAEGRYRLMPGIVRALAAGGTPFSILTEGTMLTRYLDLLAEAATRVPVAVSVSLAALDGDLRSAIEPGAPSPAARLELVRRVRAARLPCGVLLAPILPGPTDTDGHLEELVREVAAAGAAAVSGLPLRLILAGRYRDLYGAGASVRASYAATVGARMEAAVAR